MKVLRIATRQSKLALWQANHVKRLLQQLYLDLKIELVGITTKGDRVLDKKLADIGGKGLFIKELEQALLSDQADIAVHSMKDVPPYLPEGLQLGAILLRDDPRDAFLSKHYASVDDLPQGACVGTCSVRRQAQLLHHRPDLNIISLRGNVDTRLAKLESGDYDAIILATAGLNRLQLQQHIREIFTPEFMLPSVAQGAIGIECREDAKNILALIKPLNDENTARCIHSERRLIQLLNGNCHSPIGSYAEIVEGKIKLQGLVAGHDGKTVIRHTLYGDDEQVAEDIAKNLISQGSEELLLNR